MYGSALKKRLAKSKARRNPTSRKIKSAKKRITKRITRDTSNESKLHLAKNGDQKNLATKKAFCVKRGF